MRHVSTQGFGSALSTNGMDVGSLAVVVGRLLAGLPTATDEWLHIMNVVL